LEEETRWVQGKDMEVVSNSQISAGERKIELFVLVIGTPLCFYLPRIPVPGLHTGLAGGRS
jgi:hypothetical protein